MSNAAMLSCKLALFRRCVRAVLLSVAVQFLLLAIFLLFVNFELWHPLQWVAGTLRLVCSFYTWFASIPLIGAVVLYGITLSQQHLAERRYCSTRYRWMLNNGPRKLLFLGAHLLVGYLTAWLYTGYLHSDYRHLLYRCYGQDCLSSYHVYLLGMGIAAGCYYFVSVHLHYEVTIDYPIVEQSSPKKLRELLFATLKTAPINSLLPTLSYSLIFALLGSFARQRFSHLLGVDADDRLVSILDVASNVRCLFYAWLLSSQILSNMHLMKRFYAMLLSEELPLIVSRNRLASDKQPEVTVVTGLGLFNIYVVQCLAAHFLYAASKRKDSPVRREIFQLTEPGNRPANWRELCDQCVSIVGNFTDELNDSMRQISVIKGSEQHLTTAHSDINAALLAEKVLLRQYNQLYGIRSAVAPSSETSPEPRHQQWNAKPQDGIRHVPSWCERLSTQLEESLQRVLRRIPGIVYLFGESEGAKTLFLVEHSLPIVWVTQALAHICVASLKEDRYGVVQDDLPTIIKALHRLKCELDKLSSSNTSNLKAATVSFNYLRCAVRRSLYNVCNSFYDYLEDIMTPGEELRQLQSFVHHG
ncbi:nucleoporin Ndc1 [Drosophila sulfurigaster albostrigata]|uniref:nucleoporin Ndc1 n=1 Tax=Drosophila sulfurigaster albostrigata TaxID=89887 RepID=UPI002D218B97|nr:nucleoporin Ndc1 [Drosophila sulfurigaster albostrigata]